MDPRSAGSASPKTAHEAALLLHAARQAQGSAYDEGGEVHRPRDDRAQHQPFFAERSRSSLDNGAFGYQQAVHGGEERRYGGEAHEGHGHTSADGSTLQGSRLGATASASAPVFEPLPDADASTAEPSNSGPHKTGKRVSQACIRCRRQKLKCMGTYPCDRCVKGRYECDFGAANLPPGPRPGQAQQSAAAAALRESNTRLKELEDTVATLLSQMSATMGQSGQAPRPASMARLFQQAGLDPAAFGIPSAGPAGLNGAAADALGSSLDPALMTSGAGPGSSGMEQPAAWQAQSTLPAPTHSRPLMAPRLSTDIVSASTAMMQDPHVRFATSPHTAYSAPSLTSPSNAASSGISPGSALSGDGLHPRRSGKQGKGQKAEERLAAATEEGFEPPFKSLVYQPAVWDNREQSNRSSPQPSGLISRDESNGGSSREREDPINTGLLDVHIAQILFTFFIENCHPFLPVVNVGLPDTFSTIRQSPFLTSAILAIAARFYPRHRARDPMAGPTLPSGTSAQLADMAEAHLGRTLLRKQHALSDVQAILIMAAWGLQSGGRGPDAWIVTGHAARIARRLGVHQALAQASDRARATDTASINATGLDVLTEDAVRLERFLPQWRTWLGWFTFDGLLSLGFGRPQSSQFETVDEQGFLTLRLNQTRSQAFPHPGSPASRALHGDVYIAGQVQLAQVGRDIVAWSAMLTDPERALKADPRRADVVRDKELSVNSMLSDLNRRLDEWSKLWVWSGSPYTSYLGPSSRIARLHAEHMRLCLNSFALQANPEKDDFIAACLRKGLMAAQSTIQTHFDSSQTDLALSFATDYLTITLAQAAVFLVRLAKCSAPVQTVVTLDISVVVHYLKMAVDVLEGSDLSETRLSTFLGRTIRDIARAGGIKGLGATPVPTISAAGSQSGNTAPSADEPFQAGASDVQQIGFGTDLSAFDLDPFLGFEHHLNLESLLGLPGDMATSGTGMADVTNNGFALPIDQTWNQLSASGMMGEFEFGIGGTAGLGWMGFDMDGNGT